MADVVTVVEFYRPYWSSRNLPRPIAFVNRNDAIRSASNWAAKLAADQFGTFEVSFLNDYRDADYIIVYDDSIGTHREEVALMFDAEFA